MNNTEYETQPIEPRLKEKKDKIEISKRTLWIIGALICIALIGYVVYQNVQEKKIGELQGAFLYGGQIALSELASYQYQNGVVYLPVNESGNVTIKPISLSQICGGQG